MKDKTFTISELAEHLDISSSTIRFYENKGLLQPNRTSGNQRFYTLKDRGRLKLIIRGKRFGASLDEIAEMVGHADTEFNEVEQINTSLYYLEKKEGEIREKIDELQIFSHDLQALKNKLLKRKKELSQKKLMEDHYV